MRLSSKSAILNKYIIIAFALLIIISLLSWAVSTEFVKSYIFFEPLGRSTSRKELLTVLFPFYSYPIEGFSMIQMIVPVFAMLAIMPFFKAKNTFLNMYTRVKSYKTFLVKTILKHVFIASITLFLAYLVFLFIGVALLPIVKDPGTPREIFTEFLGVNFYRDHVIIYFIIEGFLKYFVFTFVYALFAVALSFLTKKLIYVF